MKKDEIITLMLPKLNANQQIEFQRYSRNPFFKYVKAEMLFQYFVCKLLDKHNIKYVLLQNEGKKTYFERFLADFSGVKRGWSDLFIPELKLFAELKSEKPLKKNGELKAGEHLHEQFNFLRDMKLIGYDTFFLYPENIDILIGYINSKNFNF